MEYTQIKVSSKDDPKRFNRLIAVLGNPDLLELGAIIGQSVNAWFEHAYLFRKPKENKCYVIESWVDDFGFNSDDYSMAKTYLSDLGDTFIYEYDTGEGYEFDCKVFKKKLNYVEDDYDEEDYPIAFVVKGNGQGIFENAHGTLWKYLDGHIDPKSQGDEEEYDFLPMNMDFEKFGDFDAPLDLEEYIFYKESIDLIADNYRENRVGGTK